MSFKTIRFRGIVSVLLQARCEAHRAPGAGFLWQR